MKSHVGIAARMFRALADEGINIQMISTVGNQNLLCHQ